MMNRQEIDQKIFLAFDILLRHRYAKVRDSEYPLQSDIIELQQAKCLIDELLGSFLKSSHGSNHSEAPIAQTQLLGDVPTEAQASTITYPAGVSCETGSVRQNEKAKEVCPCCGNDKSFSEVRTIVRCSECGNFL